MATLKQRQIKAADKASSSGKASPQRRKDIEKNYKNSKSQEKDYKKRSSKGKGLFKK